jgi:DNA uptake protein ComE-like DNA-binding protein
MRTEETRRQGGEEAIQALEKLERRDTACHVSTENPRRDRKSSHTPLSPRPPASLSPYSGYWMLDTGCRILDYRESSIKNRASRIEHQESRTENGLSLISVMWIITILTVLASEFIYSMQLEVRIARNWSDQVSAFYAAKGGLETAIAVLRDDETEYDSLDEDWAEEITGELNNSTYSTVLTDESAKINANTADEETLTKAILYSMGSSDIETSDQSSAEAQILAAAVIDKRPYRTVAEMAKADNMTPDLLYGESDETSEDETVITDEEEVQSSPLVDTITVYSVDKNTTSDGAKRVNINSADSNQIQQGINPEGEEIITRQEAQAIVDYREELQSNQPGQSGQRQDNQPDQGAGGQTDQEAYKSIAQLLDVPAISEETFDSIRNRITVSDEGEEEGQKRVNINTAGANELRSLSNSIDDGIAESIVRYREQRQFENIDEIRQVKTVPLEDMRVIVDRVTTSDDEVLQGKVNINTAPLEVLEMLPGLDEEKALAIIAHREVEEGQESAVTVPQQGDQETGPFTGLGQLLDVDGIDENTFRGLIDHVTYRSYALKIESEGRSSDGKIVQSCTAVVDRSGNSIKIRYWKQE